MLSLFLELPNKPVDETQCAGFNETQKKLKSIIFWLQQPTNSTYQSKQYSLLIDLQCLDDFFYE